VHQERAPGNSDGLKSTKTPLSVRRNTSPTLSTLMVNTFRLGHEEVEVCDCEGALVEGRSGRQDPRMKYFARLFREFGPRLQEFHLAH